MQTGSMSFLDAVNKVLAVTGDSPISTLDDTYIQSSIAKQILERSARDVLSRGWWFNEDEDVKLSPDLNGYINLAPNVIKIQVNGDKGGIVQRGARMYNRAKRTYKFTEAICVDTVINLEWTELPQVARTYISNLACIRFNNEFFGDDNVKQNLQVEFVQSEQDMNREDTENRDINLLRTTRAYNVAFRNRRW